MSLLSLPNTKNRIFGLDLLRFFAIFFVVYTHGGHFFPLRDHISVYASIIYDGVGIFFVLSGFLIGSILIKQLLISDLKFGTLLHFWKQRWSRTLPNYYLFFLLSIALDYTLGITTNGSYYPYYLVFLQNFNHMVMPFFGNSWSLSVEEWFYLLVPFLIFLLIKTKMITPKRAFIISCLLVIIIVNITRISKYLHHQPMTFDDFDNIRYAVTCRLDSIMFGMIGAYLKFYHNDFWNRIKKTGLFIGVVGLVIHYLNPLSQHNLFYQSLFSFAVTSITVLSFLPYLSSWKTNNSILGKTITYISLISYSLYLINSLVIVIISELPNWDLIEKFVATNISKNHSWGIIFTFNYILFWVASIALSALIYKYFEVPMMNYFRRKKTEPKTL